MNKQRKVRQGSVYLDPVAPPALKTVILGTERVVDGQIRLAGEKVSIPQSLADAWIEEQKAMDASEEILWEAPAPVALQEVRLCSQQVIGGSVRMRDDIVSVDPQLAHQWIASGEAEAIQSPTPETDAPKKKRKAE